MSPLASARLFAVVSAAAIVLAVLSSACSDEDTGGTSSSLSCDRDRDCPSSKPDCRDGRCRTRTSASDGGTTTSGDAGGSSCTPATCEELDVECGQVPDGCEGFRYCGDCTLPETCGGGGTPSFCGCRPDCTDAVCGDDGCGGTCGECPGDGACSDGACCVGLYELCVPTAYDCCAGTYCRLFYDGSLGGYYDACSP